MELKQLLEKMQEKILSKADVKFVFGNLIETKKKSIIPVSVIKYHLGGGIGKGPDLAKIKGVAKDDEKAEKPTENRPSGEGAGGKFSNNPLGVFEITEDSTRFVPVIPLKPIYIAISIWIVLKVLKKKR